MTNYVAGFAFSSRYPREVLLVRKDHPEGQKNKFNGIGGATHPEERPADAMCREFEEETRIATLSTEWERIVILRSGEHDIHFYRTQLDHETLVGRNGKYNDSGERLHLIYWPHLLSGQYAPVGGMIPNLAWLLPLAAYRHDTYHPLYAVETSRG